MTGDVSALRLDEANNPRDFVNRELVNDYKADGIDSSNTNFNVIPCICLFSKVSDDIVILSRYIPFYRI